MGPCGPKHLCLSSLIWSLMVTKLERRKVVSQIMTEDEGPICFFKHQILYINIYILYILIYNNINMYIIICNYIYM